MDREISELSRAFDSSPDDSELVFRLLRAYERSISPLNELPKQFIDHVFLLTHSTSSPLMEDGVFPDGWVIRYLDLLKEAGIWQQREYWPKALVSAIHSAVFFLEFRYNGWRKESGQRNPDTERSLSQIRLSSHVFLLQGGNDLVRELFRGE